MRRRQLLTGLVSVTGAAAPRAPDRASTAPAGSPNRLLVTSAGTTAQPVSVQAVRSSLAAARSLFQGCRYSDLARTLPDVITAAHTSCDAATGEQRETLAALLADSYSLASELCNKLHDYALAWVTADRARSAAQASGDPASIAEAARMAAIAMRRHGHHSAAVSLLADTALSLGADTGSPGPNLLGTYGSLLCTAAYTAAQHDHRSRALELIGESEETARRLDGATPNHTSFSATNVTIYQIGVRTALGDAGTALDYAHRIEIRSLPTAERQARFALDTARAWHRFGDPHRCYQALHAAEHLAPEELRRPSVRSLVAGLLHAPGAMPAGLREFATRIGATA